MELDTHIWYLYCVTCFQVLSTSCSVQCRYSISISLNCNWVVKKLVQIKCAVSKDIDFHLLHRYIVVAVGSSGILKGKQKLGVTFNSDKLGGIDFTKFSKLSMCSAGTGRYWLVLVKVYVQASSQALHMVSFENFVKSMTPSLLELKVTPSFCFPFKIPDDPTATTIYILSLKSSL